MRNHNSFHHQNPNIHHMESFPEYTCEDRLDAYLEEEKIVNEFNQWDKELLKENQSLKKELEAIKAKQNH